MTTEQPAEEKAFIGIGLNAIFKAMYPQERDEPRQGETFRQGLVRQLPGDAIVVAETKASVRPQGIVGTPPPVVGRNAPETEVRPQGIIGTSPPDIRGKRKHTP